MQLQFTFLNFMNYFIFFFFYLKVEFTMFLQFFIVIIIILLLFKHYSINLSSLIYYINILTLCRPSTPIGY